MTLRRVDDMNTPRSREGNLVRGTIYLIGYFIIFGARRLAISGGKVRLWGGILFFLLSLMMLIFYVYRFNRESRYFQKEEQLLPLTDHFGQLALTTVVIFVLRMLVNYLQLTKGLGLTAVQQSYHTGATSGTFWFMIFAEGIIISALQQFIANGFLFNYFFRTNTRAMAVAGIITSAIIYALLNFSATPLLFGVSLLIGGLISWAYLATQSMWVPVLLAVFNGILTVILL